MSKQSFVEQIKNFFRADDRPNYPGNVRTLLIRQDGQVLYHDLPSKEQNFGASIGALVGGAWQAASTLGSYISQTREDIFRFSFDTSDQGIYVLPVRVEKEVFYLGALYINSQNPGLLKQQLRSLALRLQAYLLKNTYKPKSKNLKNSSTEFLFNNISDADMDRLFSFEGP